MTHHSPPNDRGICDLKIIEKCARKVVLKTAFFNSNGESFLGKYIQAPFI
jgi:hypothetical protein